MQKYKLNICRKIKIGTLLKRDELSGYYIVLSDSEKYLINGIFGNFNFLNIRQLDSAINLCKITIKIANGKSKN